MRVHHNRQDIASYVRRGRTTRAQCRALQSGSPLLLKPDIPLTAQWPGCPARLCVEIGCGNGTNLMDMASRYADWAHVGVDVYAAGIGRILARCNVTNPPNLRLIRGDHNLALAVLGECSTDLCMLLFPDPWPKRRHHKRRLVQQGFIHQLHKLLKPGGMLWFATDWHNYAGQVLAHMAQQSGFVPASPALQRATTRFEQRAMEQARQVFEYCWVKTG